MDLPKSPAPQAGLYADESRPCVTCSSAAQREMELDERSRFASADDDLGSCTAITSKVTAKAYSALRLNTTSRGSLQSASRTRTFRPERHPGSRSGIVSTAGGWGVKSYLSGSVRLIARPQGIGKPARSLALPPSSRSATSSFCYFPHDLWLPSAIFVVRCPPTANLTVCSAGNEERRDLAPRRIENRHAYKTSSNGPRGAAPVVG
jgi:hypothetical protein